MVSKTQPGMTEVARLTRLGRLAEATVLIQHLLQDGTGTAPSCSSPPAVAGPERRAAQPLTQLAGSAAGFEATQRDKPRTGLGRTLQNIAARAKAAALGNSRVADYRPAPDPLPGRGTFTWASYTNAAGTRAYKLFVPTDALAGGARPLIVMLHGCTQSPDDFAAGTRMNRAAGTAGAFVAYPQQPSSANPQKCWNWFKPGDQTRERGEPSLIAGIVRQVMRDYPIDPSRVYVAGLSAGGAAAAILGAAYPDLFAAVGVHSGLPAGAASGLTSALNAMRSGAVTKARTYPAIPTIVFHGDEDTTVHPRNGDAIVVQAGGAASGLRQSAERTRVKGGRDYTRRIYTSPDGSAICEQWTIHGAGHAWSGGNSSGSYTDPLGPDASREMLRFFLDHSLAKPKPTI